jgi:hypothetical protein
MSVAKRASLPGSSIGASSYGGSLKSESSINAPLQKAKGKRPLRPSSQSGSYNSGHDSNSSGSINPNAIAPRASGQRSYGSVYDVPGASAGKFARVSKEVFLEVQRQKDIKLKAQKPGFRLARKRLQIRGVNT